MRIVVVGAGWAGISAAYEAKRCGADVLLIERTDMLLGTGLVGGIIRNNARYTVFEELKAMGVKELINLIDETVIHKDIKFPGHKHASLYDVTKIERKIKDILIKMGINIIYKSRMSNVNLKDNKIVEVIVDDGTIYKGDVFIDATGTAGPMHNCIKYGYGCSMCILRCPTYKGRISLTNLCNIKESIGKKEDGSIGSMSGSCKLLKDSIAPNIINKLNKKGVVIVPLPQDLKENHLSIKACQQYALNAYKDNLVLLDTGCVKLMTPYYELSKLRKIKGFENARYLDPYSGGNGNSIRFLAIAPYDNTLKVQGVDNLFCVGEKTGLIGHAEAIMTGILAGYNAVKLYNNEELLIIPRSCCIGEAIAYTNEQLNTEYGLTKKYTVSGSVLFERLKDKKLYTINIKKIEKRITRLKLENIF